MEYQNCAIKINTEGYYIAPQMTGGDANFWSQTIGLYNGYIYNARHVTSRTEDRIQI